MLSPVQVDHHLFPMIPRHKLGELHTLVESFCKVRGGQATGCERRTVSSRLSSLLGGCGLSRSTT